MIPSIGNDFHSKQRFSTMSSLLWDLSRKYECCYFLSAGKLFVENGQVNRKYYKDNYHLNALGSKLLSQQLSILSKEIYEQYNWCSQKASRTHLFHCTLRKVSSTHLLNCSLEVSEESRSIRNKKSESLLNGMIVFKSRNLS